MTGLEVVYWLGIGLLCTVATFSVYLLPALIAKRRAHRQTLPILLINLLFGWTVLGWFIALIWSSSAVRTSRRDMPRA